MQDGPWWGRFFWLLGFASLPTNEPVFFWVGGGFVLKVAGVCVLFLNVMFLFFFFWEGFYGSTSPLYLTGL